MSRKPAVLADLDAALAELGRQAERDWTALDGPKQQLSTAKSLSMRWFGRFGQFGRSRTDESSGDLSIHDVDSAGTGTASPNKLPREDTLVKGVQTVQSVQSPEKPLTLQRLAVGRPALDTVQKRPATVQDPAAARGSEPEQSFDRINRWLAAHPPAPCPPDQCAHCGGFIDARGSNAVAVLRTLEPGQVLWLHSGCHHPWYQGRRQQAREAVAQHAAGPALGP